MLYYTSTTTVPPAAPSSFSSSSTFPSSMGNTDMAGSSGSMGVDGTSSSSVQGSPYTPSAPIPNAEPCSDSAAQGVEFQNALQGYIKKDEIPCYGCTL